MALFKKTKIKDIDAAASILTKRTRGEKILYSIVSILLGLYALSLLYPMFYLVVNSFQDKLTYTNNLAYGGNPFALPEKWHFENYKIALTGMSVISSTGRAIYLPEMFFNTIWITACSIFGNILFAAFTGYVMSKYHFGVREIIYTMVIFSMTLPVVGTSGSYFKLISDLGLYNTPAYVFVTCIGGWGFNFMIMYGFFKNISWSYAEAVFIDGGGHFKAFFNVMLPQAMGPLITLSIVAFISGWNDYMTSLLYMPDYPKIGSGIYLIQTSFTRNGNVPAYFAGLVCSVIPTIVVFICFSDTIMKNLTVGGLKG